MSDDLVHRLRTEWVNDDGTLCELAADRIEALEARCQGHSEPCYYCGEPCNSFAGDPDEWPIPLCHSDDPGKVKWHHTGCITDRLRRIEALEAALREIGYGNIGHGDVWDIARRALEKKP